MKPITSIVALLNLVYLMRSLQRNYYASKHTVDRKELLIRAKQAEVKLDKILDELVTLVNDGYSLSDLISDE